jgi:hypothetical protein
MAMRPLGLYVDDNRSPPDNDGVNWIVCRTFHLAICFLEGTNFPVVSLDHDLACFYGQREMTGRDILNWLIARKLDGKYTPDDVRVHSANPVGCDTMESDIKRYWG